MPEEGAPKDSGERPVVLFHFIKSNQFRVIHVDGVHGGVTPHMQVQMALFSERLPIPQQTSHYVTAEGSLVEPPFDVSSKVGVVREVEVEALMDLGTAKALLAWLGDRVSALEQLVSTAARRP